MGRSISLQLSAYAAILFAAIGVVQLGASISFYRAIDAQTLREDHARRVAELLVVSDRVFRVEAPLTPEIMTSRHLQVAVREAPVVAPVAADKEMRELAQQIVRWEPGLAGRRLHLAVRPAARGLSKDLVGSMQLSPGHWLNFRSHDISSMWPVVQRAAWMTLVTTLVCLAAGLFTLRLLTRPLRRLSEAARAIGHGRHVAIRENGPTDLRNLAHAMNDMQDRIARLLEDQAKSFEAISHDLRTPLSRQKIAADLISDRELGEILRESVDEMDAMLQSLQQFLRAQHLSSEPEQLDLDALLQDLVDPLGDRSRFVPGSSGLMVTYREPLRLSLSALIENAGQYASRVDVSVQRLGDDWFVVIKDDGPGIPAEYFEDVLAPFFRLDEARGRTTKGFGLGIPTAYRLLTRFGGGLAFSRGSGDGLDVRVRIPRPL